MNSTPADFEGAPNGIKRRAAWLTYPGFKLVHGYDADARAPSELLLVPSKQSAGRPALTRRDHRGKVSKMREFPEPFDGVEHVDRG